MNKKDKKYIEVLKEYNCSVEVRVKYFLECFDVLIIFFLSGGLVLSISFYENFKDVDKMFINVVWIFFLGVLIINLLF